MAQTKLLLSESIRNLGKVGDVVEVSPGYARNYLLPKGLAVQPTPNNIKKIEVRRKEIERLEAEKKAAQSKTIAALANVELTLERRANESGTLFGSVSATDIAKSLQAIGHSVQAEDVLLPGKLDHIEKYVVTVKFAEDLQTEIKVWVAPDAESKAAIDQAEKDRKSAAKTEEE